MSSSFRNVALIGRIDGQAVVDSVRHVAELLESRNINVLLERETAAALAGSDKQASDKQIATRTTIAESCDLAIVVGGDGSLLGAARELARAGVPLLGINRGRLGFLTDIGPEEIEEKVGAVLQGDYTVEERFLLDMELKRGKASIARSNALNDVVLHSGQAPKMLNFELYIEGEFVYSQHSDGLIVSTPTGSTAYSLSGGGPIMHPRLNAIVLVPMFPHTLSSRPLVIDGTSEIKIIIADNNPETPSVSCDGQVNTLASPGDVLYIRKSPKRAKLVHPIKHSFYETCRNKLSWGKQLIGE